MKKFTKLKQNNLIYYIDNDILNELQLVSGRLQQWTLLSASDIVINENNEFIKMSYDFEEMIEFYLENLENNSDL